MVERVSATNYMGGAACGRFISHGPEGKRVWAEHKFVFGTWNSPEIMRREHRETGERR